MSTEINKPPKVRLVRGQEVSLGCGTLILIALIVIIFGGYSGKGLEGQIRSLQLQIVELQKAVEAQTEEIRQLRSRLPAPKEPSSPGD